MEFQTYQPEPGEGALLFNVGDLVVHPHHGAGRIVSRRRRLLAGVERDYLEIELADSALKIMVPYESAAAVGLRAVAGPHRPCADPRRAGGQAERDARKLVCARAAVSGQAQGRRRTDARIGRS